MEGRETQEIPQRKKNRLENKKRKLKAYLELVQSSKEPVLSDANRLHPSKKLKEAGNPVSNSTDDVDKKCGEKLPLKSPKRKNSSGLQQSKKERKKDKKKLKTKTSSKIIKDGLKNKKARMTKLKLKTKGSHNIQKGLGEKENMAISKLKTKTSSKILKVGLKNKKAKIAKLKLKTKRKGSLNIVQTGLDGEKENIAISKVKAKLSPNIVKDRLDDTKAKTEVLDENIIPEYVPLDKAISDFDYMELKNLKREITKSKLPWPFIELTEVGLKSRVTSDDGDRQPLTVKDIQTSVLHLLMPGRFPIPSRWANIVRSRMVSHIVTVVVEGLSISDIKCIKNQKSTLKKKNLQAENAKKDGCLGETNLNGTSQTSTSSVPVPEWLSYAFPRTCAQMPLTFEVLSSCSSKSWEDLLYTTNSNLPWSRVMNGCSFQGDKEASQQDDQACESMPVSSVNKDCNIDFEKNAKNLPPSDAFDRRQLLLTPTDLYMYKFPIPCVSMFQNEGYVLSKDKFEEVKPTSPMFGIDCEMCLTTTNKLELTSVSIVNEKLKLIYHKLVKPPNRIINYLTRFSGITENVLRHVTTTLQDVHRDLKDLLPPDAIIVGHSLNNDLKAMKVMHPYVIDSAVAYNLSYIRQRPSSLQVLTKIFLDREIQMNPGGHDPTEDALASLELIQLKLKNDVNFGNVIQGFKMQNVDKEDKEVDSSLPIKEPEVIGSKEVDSSLPIKEPEVNGSPEGYFNLFQHATRNKVKMAVLMTPSTAKECEDILGSVSEKIDMHILPGNKHISKKAAEISIDKDFTYLHMKMDKLKTSKSSKSQKHQMEKLDKRLERIFNGACQKSMLMYIFTGSSMADVQEKSSNGLFMCCIKGLEENL